MPELPEVDRVVDFCVYPAKLDKVLSLTIVTKTHYLVETNTEEFHA